MQVYNLTMDDLYKISTYIISSRFTAVYLNLARLILCVCQKIEFYLVVFQSLIGMFCNGDSLPSLYNEKQNILQTHPFISDNNQITHIKLHVLRKGFECLRPLVRASLTKYTYINVNIVNVGIACYNICKWQHFSSISSTPDISSSIKMSLYQLLYSSLLLFSFMILVNLLTSSDVIHKISSSTLHLE